MPVEDAQGRICGFFFTPSVSFSSFQAEDGAVYYHHEGTNETSWEKPADLAQIERLAALQDEPPPQATVRRSGRTHEKKTPEVHTTTIHLTR